MTQTQKRSQELEFALDIADRAGDVALDYFRQGITATMKHDNTPVTAADKECEALIRRAIAQRFPGDAILGEEEGQSPDAATAKRKWIIDPIDGTYNYARQIPIWALLLAFERDGQIELGVVHAPAMGETFWAERGGGAFRNGQPVHVSGIKTAAESLFVFGGPNRIISSGGPLAGGLKRVIGSTYRQRAFGDYLNFAYVFAGKAESALETGVQPWDLAPMKIIAEEAGGRYSDLEGGTSIYKGSCLVSNGLVHDEMLRLLLD